MSSRWISKLVVLSAFVLMALPVVAFAQTSRLEGMTLQGDYVKDYTNMFTFPSTVVNAGNLAYGELGSTGGVGTVVSDRAMGSVLNNLFDGRFGIWAIHLRQTTPDLGAGDGSSFNANDPNTNSNEEFDVMWGKKLGTLSLGLRVNRSFWAEEVNAPPAQTTLKFNPSAGFPPTANSANLARNIMGFGGGVTFEMNPNATVDVGLLYQSRTFENTTSPIGAATNDKEDGGTSYLLSGRAMWQWQSNVMLTPLASFYSYDLSRQQITAAGTTSFDNTMKGWQLGLAANWALGSNDMLVWGVDFIQNKFEQDDALFTLPTPPPPGIAAGANTDITESQFPRIFAALETHVNSWLTVRMGASKGAFQKIKIEPRAAGSTSTDITTTSFDMNLGTGVKLGTLQLDAVLANNTFQFSNGLLGGGTPTGGFFPKVTATYSF
jgi:hypothetical protein